MNKCFYAFLFFSRVKNYFVSRGASINSQGHEGLLYMNAHIRVIDRMPTLICVQRMIFPKQTVYKNRKKDKFRQRRKNKILIPLCLHLECQCH